MEQFNFKNLIIITVCLLLSGCSFLGFTLDTGSSRSAIERTNQGGVYKSINKGEKITHKIFVNEKEDINKLNVKTLEFDLRDTLTLYLLSKYNGLWVTYNGTESWQQITDNNFTSFALDPKTRKILFVTKGVDVLKSINGGSSWDIIFTEPSNNVLIDIAINPKDSEHILTVTKDGIVFESTNHGDAWSVLSTDVKLKSVNQIQFNPKNSQEVYLTTNAQGVYISYDSAKTWAKISALDAYKDSNKLNQFKINPKNPRHLYHASAYGLLRSLDSGQSWHSIPLLATSKKAQILAIGFNPFDERQLYYLDKNSLYRSTDSGKTWMPTPMPTTKYPVEILVDDFDTNIVYVGVSSN